MTAAVFIDGGHGTTGLEIRQRLAGRDDIALVELGEARRDPAARREALRDADFAILCLPDGAAREAVAMAEGSRVRIIDASTAHRVAPGWVYGLPEIETGRAEEIAGAARVANPGCYAATFVAMVRPLVRAGLLRRDRHLTVNAVSGYSGGGRAMIEEFESGAAATAFRTYGLALDHKHLPEMQAHSGIAAPPLFAPAVAALYRGMIVEVPLAPDLLEDGVDARAVRGALAEAYRYAALIDVLDEETSLSLQSVAIERCAGTDRMEIIVFANPASGQIRLCATLDNLGKGAAGSAVQNLNLMIGCNPLHGLHR